MLSLLFMESCLAEKETCTDSLHDSALSIFCSFSYALTIFDLTTLPWSADDTIVA